MLSAMKKARMIKGLTQTEFARELGVTPQAVCRWEHGKCLPNVKRLKQISAVLDTTVDKLLQEHEGRKEVQ